MRTILESKAGYQIPQPASKIDSIISQTWKDVFTTPAQVFDPTYKPVICQKILKHYYLREIGMETFGNWMYFMNRTFEEYIDYYNKLWESQLLKFDPFQDVDLTTTNKTTGNKTSTEKGASSGSETDSHEDTSQETYGDKQTESNTRDITRSGKSDTSTDTKYVDLYSDTPQGTITNLESMKYLTNATIDTTDNTEGNTWSDTSKDVYSGTRDDNSTRDHTGSGSYNRTSSGNTSRDGTVNSLEDYLSHVVGKTGGVSYSKLLVEYRQTFMNIDNMFIQEFETCFMSVWDIF